MPDVPIVDTHVHLWDPEEYPLPWLEGEAVRDSEVAPIAGRRFALAEYEAATRGVDVAGMVYVEVDADPAYGLVEARWVAERAREEPRIGAIVAWAPIEHGRRVRSYLRALAEVDPLVKGVRRLLQAEAVDFCLQPGFLDGLRTLPEFGFSFDICVLHHHLPAVVEMVRRCPEVSFVLDHLGKPNIRGRQLDPWREHIRALAELPNVVCKVSGAVTEADLVNWTADDLAPYVSFALDAFGEDRVLFGGDWPVVLLASPLQRWIETLDGLTADLSREQRRKLWAENARRVYRMGTGTR